MPLRCTFNPIAGRESRFPKGSVGKAEVKKNGAIIGAGPAGLEAAYIAGQRGHNVTIYEASDRLCGGQLLMASSSPCKDILQHVPEFFKAQLSRMDNVDIKLSTPVTEDNVGLIDADYVLLATGASALVPPIPGIEKAKTGQDVLIHKADVKGEIVICGGGQVGVETALELLERGHKVSIVEMLPDLILKEELMTRIVMMKKLAAAEVKVYCQHKVSRFTDSGVEVEDMQTGEKKLLPCDDAVIAFGTKAENKLYDTLCENFDEVHIIGDASTPDTITTAIHDGFFAALEI